MKIVVAGHGMVGHQFLQSLAETGLTDAQVTVLCEEARPAYDRVHLSEFFAGKSAQDLSLVEPGFFERTVRPAPGPGRQRGPPGAHRVTTADGEVLPYDKLVLATGSVPFVPHRRPRAAELLRLPHHRRPGGHAGGQRQARRGVVVGGGLLGLECAKALRDLGLETHVVEFAPRLMAVQVDESGGRILREKIEALGVRAHPAQHHPDHRRRRAPPPHGVRGRQPPRDRHDRVLRRHPPRDELARQCVLAIGPRGGVVIDDHCRTSDRMSTPSANARPGTSRPSAWWPRATRWPAWPRATSPARPRPPSRAPT
jgi:nitrite reductase (NADH) large subunit